MTRDQHISNEHHVYRFYEVRGMNHTRFTTHQIVLLTIRKEISFFECILVWLGVRDFDWRCENNERKEK